MSRHRLNSSPMAQEFVRLPAAIIDWYESQGSKSGTPRATLYRKAIISWKEGARGMTLTQDEVDWLTLFRQYNGLAGDRETLRALVVIAARAFVSAEVAGRVRDLAAELAPRDVRDRSENEEVGRPRRQPAVLLDGEE